MRIDTASFAPIPPANLEPAPQPQRPSLTRALSSAVESVNDLQVQADKEAERLATGDADNLHTALISMQKAHVALQLTAQVTRRAVQAYQEIMRLQA